MSQPQRVLILGGSGGLGRALAAQLRASNSHVFLAARDAERLEAAAHELGGAPSATCDATDAEQVDALFERAAEELGGLTGVVNAVGSILLKPAHLTSPADFRETLAQNLDSAFNVVRSGAKRFSKTGGSIALVSSCAAQVGLSNHEAIAAAKAGVEGLTRSAAATYAPRGVRVNAVAPGLVDTPMAGRLLASDASRKASEALHPLGRVGRPEEVASALAWLLDPAQAWVTGQILGVDGGLARVRPRS